MWQASCGAKVGWKPGSLCWGTTAAGVLLLGTAGLWFHGPAGTGRAWGK